MRRHIVTTVAAFIVAGAVTPVLADTLMTFEEFIGFDSANVSTFYSGISFQTDISGSDWKARDATSNNYNISSYPSGQQWNDGNYWIHGYVGATTALDSTGNGGRIYFNNGDATYVELAYTAFTNLYLEAYDANDNLLDADVGGPNLRYVNNNSGGPGTLRVDWNGTDYIKWVRIHDSGNFWVVDNIQTNATGITTGVVPLPAAAFMGMSLLGGVGGVGFFRRRRLVEA
jgi:hypothetical protein